MVKQFRGILMLLPMCLVLVLSEDAHSTNLLNFASLHNGHFSNEDQALKEKNASDDRHDVVDLYFIPVDVPAFYPNISFFFEEVDNGVMYRLQLRVIGEDGDGNIRFQHYNLTVNPSLYEVGSYDFDSLRNLRKEDLEPLPECEALFTAIETNVFLGTLPDCHHRHYGMAPPKYIAVFSCSGVYGYSPEASLERDTKLPYSLKAVERYPLLPYMLGDRDDYKSPCTN